jgi:DNA-binding MarR family transcriptional regulator
MSHSAMSDELGISVSAVTQVANRLESMGLVSRVESATDRRVKLLKLTSYGEQCMEERQEQRVQRASAVLGTMTDSAQEQLLTVLTDFLEESSKVKKQLGVLPSATENDEAIA